MNFRQKQVLAPPLPPWKTTMNVDIEKYFFQIGCGFSNRKVSAFKLIQLY